VARIKLSWSDHSKIEELLMKRFLMAFFIVLLISIAPAGVSAAVQLPDFTELVEETSPAVVHIQTSNVGRRRNNNSRSEEVPEFFRRFFDTPEMPEGHPFGEERRGGGSGFIVDSGGYIVTNHHVVEGAEKILVRLADRREYEAEVVGSDQQSDIALLKVQAEGLPTLPLGDSDALKRGQWVIAIGSPFALEQTVTAGIISGKGRSNGQQQYVPFLQTDVAINRGNSGGPLLNLDGEVCATMAGSPGDYWVWGLKVCSANWLKHCSWIVPAVRS
jgi:serine protease Do